MNPQIDRYLLEGCMRCELGGTPKCKVHNWVPELEQLRQIVLVCGLKEELKWGVPCYTINDKNVLIVSAFKDYCSVSFFKGALISDPNSLLVKPGKNSQAGRLIKFTSLQQIEENLESIKEIILNAVEVEQAGLKIERKQNPEPIPEELENRLDTDPVLRSAFESLTPGRQRGYIIFISQPKQSKTREARIDKCIGKILNGEGLHDKYSGKKKN